MQTNTLSRPATRLLQIRTWQGWSILLTLTCLAVSFGLFHAVAAAQPRQCLSEPSADLLSELRNYRHKVIYECNRDGNWELYLVKADGSDPVNLTNTPDVDELYPRPSPDGTKVCFMVDERRGSSKVRSVYYMNADGTGRTKVADNAREPCWSPGGGQIAYMKGELQRFVYTDFATEGLFIYNLKTGKTRQHTNKGLYHLSTLNWSPDGKWFIATVHGDMGYSHANVAVEAMGDRVVDLKLDGCRPNVRPDGKKICWGHGDFRAGVADLDLESYTPQASNVQDVVESKDPVEIYHVTWSPDGKYIAYAHGPKLQGKHINGEMAEFPGVTAPGWNVCVADAMQKNRWTPITADGKSCKQPCWVVVKDLPAQ